MKKSIIRTPRNIIFLLIIVNAVIINYFFIERFNSFFETIVQKKQEEYLNTRRNTVRCRVELIKKLIQQEIRVLKENNQDLTDNEIRELIAASLNRVDMNDSYIFAGDYQGNTTVGPNAGRNMYDLRSDDGFFVVRELIRVARKGGGFIEYSMPPLRGGQSGAKLSYVTSLEEFDWFIGTGFFYEDFSAQFQSYRDELRLLNLVNIKKSIITMLVIITILLIMLYFFTERIDRQINRFISYFNDLGKGEIEENEIEFKYEEFQKLSSGLNEMIRSIRSSRKEIQKFKTLVDRSGHISLILNTDGYIQYANLSFYSIIDQKEEEVIKKPFERFFCVESPDYSKRLFDRIILFENISELELSIVNRKGDHIPVLLNMTLISDEEEPGFIAVIGMDISERKKMEQLAIQNEKMLSIGGLAAGMAHEVNNPLSGIMQSLQNIRRRFSKDNRKNREVAEEIGLELEKTEQYMKKRDIISFFDNIQESGIRAEKIVNDLFQFSHESISEKHCHDINSIVRRSVFLANSDYNLKKRFNIHDIDIKLNTPDDIPEVFCN
ncbi:MAG: cache domain-containing protein, partial [Candidatus Muiribacteriaceae bacterium]